MSGPLARRIAELEGEVERLTAWHPQSAVGAEQLRLAEQRAHAYAVALIQVTHGQRQHACKPDMYVACHAAKWLAERAPSNTELPGGTR